MKSKLLTPLFLSAECVIYLIFLILDLTGHGDRTIALKYAGILLCLVFSLVWGRDRLVPLALLFTAGADWFLLVRGDRFLLGVLLFLVVQTIYLLRLRRGGAGPSWWLRGGIALLLGLLLFSINLATPLNLAACLYFSQLLSNTLLAWAGRRRLFALGLTLFVGCDLCVGLFNSGLLPAALSQPVSVGMWFFYLPSQVLISLSSKECFHENQ